MVVIFKNFKKIKLLVVNCVLILIICICSISIFKELSFKTKISNKVSNVLNVESSVDVNNKTEATIKDDKVVDEVSYRGYIKTEGNIDDSLVLYLDNLLKVVPKDILDAYFSKGGIILLTDKNIAQTYYGDTSLGRILGLHDANNNIVYISNSENAINYALIHEFGHVLDSLTNWGSMGEDFEAIYEAEKDTFIVDSKDGHYKLNTREFFAEVFQEYILNPKTCEASAKGAFDFVGDKIKSLKVD